MIVHLTGTLRGTDRSEAWIVDGRLSFTRPDVDSAGSRAVREVSGYAYPGLLDVHTHPGLRRSPEALETSEIRRRLEILARIGVSDVRDSGGQHDPNVAWEPGLPRVIHCGQHIARYRRYERYLATETEPADLPAEALRQLAVSGGWIKVVGDWIDREVGDMTPLWPRAALKDAVAAVHEAGGKVTVHAFARETIDDLLEAGVDGIEHGTGMTRDHLLEAAARGILITPTVRQIRRFPEFAASATKYPAYQQRMLAMDAQRREHLALMVDTGTHFLMGSDSAEDVGETNLTDELICAVEDGMPADVVMAAASYDGKRRLGLPFWAEGAPADVVVYLDDPEENIATVRTPAAVFIGGHAIS
ncbi:amidohydrolase family protein [Trueperella bialowiezensis]|uniref:Amidohydrolase-related domain-containing protein n=1 Tax=Trueperella bialowiezensis TaxID=312285 RepID=A0A448PCN3_9ACTO|nr:amidohydrolase family protein [Trueperella bialowiezensis]VEI12698.1 Uncharacterised protein [Trueperella bialowiezensis]